MKRIINLLLLLTVMLPAFADSGSGEGYDPTNPPEPGEVFRVTTTAAPSQGGRTSEPQLVAAGENVGVSAYAHENFTFNCWMDGDTKVSDNPTYVFTMPAHSVNLVAFFDYTPLSPQNPVNKYRIRAFVSPSQAGNVYPQFVLLEEGESTDIEASTYENYKFEGWKLNGEILPNGPDGNPQNPLHVTMGTKNLDYTAVFSYDPQNPAEPGTNSFDRVTGTLIMDDFRPGNLANDIAEYLRKLHVLEPDSIFADRVNEVVVVGPVTPDDFNFLNNLKSYNSEYDLKNCSIVDFSRTSGENPDNFYLPWGCFGDMETLVKVVLPANLNRVESYAFSGCSNLSELICYATVPPQASYDSFGDLPTESITLRVPSEAFALYQKASGWNIFNITSLDSEACSIILTLPEYANDGRFVNNILSLENPSSKRSQRLVVNNRLEYTFSNLTPGSTYNLYMRNADGEELASITRIDMPEAAEVKRLTFDKIKESYDLTLNVTDPEGNDLNGAVEIQWKDASGKYLTSGSVIKKVVEGKELTASIVLPDYLGVTYYEPSPLKIVSAPESETVFALTALPVKVVSGRITDEMTGEPIPGGFVSVEQTISGKFRSNSRAISDEDGNYSVKFIAAETAKGIVTGGAEKYITQPCHIVNFAEMPEMQDFALKLISGTVINTSLLWKSAQSDKTEPYTDYANVDFEFYNLTSKMKVAYFSNQYPKMILLDNVSPGDEIEVKAISRTGVFDSQIATAKIGEDRNASAELTLLEHGAVKASYTGSEAANVNILLYNSTGKLVKFTQADAEKTALFSNLQAGKYTAVAIADSRYINAVNSYSDFKASGLAEGKDFAMKMVEVNDASLATVDFGVVPMLDESRFFHIEDVNLSANRTTLTVGNYVTVRASVYFTEPGIENYALRFDLPEHCSFVENSVIKGNEPSNAQMRDGYLWIDDVKPGDRVRFCLMPEKGEEFRPTGFAEFDIDGKHFSEPIGSVRFMAQDFTIFVPRRTCRDYVYARGVTTPVSDVTLYTNGVPSGNALSTADGFWVAKVGLIDPQNIPLQQVYGEIVTREGKKFPTQSTVVEYDPYYPEPEVVKMVHNGTVVNFNHNKAKTDRKSYSYNPGNDLFSLMAKFEENKERVSEVNFHIISTDGSERVIDGVYVESTQAWVAALGYSDSHRLPVNVTVDFKYTKPVPDPENPGDTIGAFSSFYLDYIAPDVTPIIDPSGFVYEAVESNRLEGVKATVFYREAKENVYGEIEWNAVKWDAEAYSQENPLFTDANGEYAWDVPQGEWQVKFEKDGYETAYSAWLPVPPPQLEVNMGMVQNTRPVVAGAHAYAGGVDVIFDKPMQLSSLTAENIYVTAKDAKLEGTLHLMTADGKLIEDNALDESPAIRLRFKPASELASTTGEIHLHVKQAVKSYAGVSMLEDYDAPLTVELEISEIKGDNTAEVVLATPTTITVSAIPANAAAGRILTIANDSPDVMALAQTEYVFDENGQAKVELTGTIPGKATLGFSVAGSDTKGSTQIEVKNVITETMMPNASLADGSEVYAGAQIELSSMTKQAVIYYTLDGTEPSADNGLIYTNPLKITGDVTVKAIAYFVGNPSKVASFNYTLKKSRLDVNLNDGWNWVSHNLADGVKVSELNTDSVERLLSQNEELVRDPKLGLIGPIETLDPTASYKIKSTGVSTTHLEALAIHPSVPVRMVEGWNWISYTSTQSMSPDEAFATTIPEEGDYILGQRGFATFDGEKWVGELTVLNPGEGYMYNSKSTKDLVYNVSLVSKAAAVNARTKPEAAAAWAVDRTKYPSVMPVIAEIVTPDGRVAEAGEYEVAAFCGSECRGIGNYYDGYLMMSVYGNASDEISFRLLPAGSDSELLVEGSLAFTESPQGSLDKPLRIDASKTNGVNSVSGPNAAVSVRDNTLWLSSAVERADIFDADGRKVISLADGGRSIPLGGLQKGVHIVAAYSDGAWSYSKIMVK